MQERSIKGPHSRVFEETGRNTMDRLFGASWYEKTCGECHCIETPQNSMISDGSGRYLCETCYKELGGPINGKET